MTTLIKHKDSHVDHGISPEQLGYILGKFSDFKRETLLGIEPPPEMKQTIVLPEWLGTVPCALRGPIVGDSLIVVPVVYSNPDLPTYAGPDPIPARDPEPGEIVFRCRGTRAYASRMVQLPPTQTRLVTVIAGPHDGHDMVLFTAYGGPEAPREVGELEAKRYIDDSPELRQELAESREFWAVHALALAHAPFTWTVEITIDEQWVADGAELTTDRMNDIMTTAFGYLRSDEIVAKTIASPDPEAVALAQGYRSAADKLERDR